MNLTNVLLIFLFSFCAIFPKANSQSKTVHVFVALCDNEFQGIVPVLLTLGNGKDPTRNLYWGAGRANV